MPQPQPPDLARVAQDVVAGSASLADVGRAIDGGASLNTWISGGASTSSSTRSLLSFAVASKHEGLVSLLLQRRSDPNVADPKGVTPLHLAAFEGTLDTLASLLEARAAVNAQDRFGQTPLFFAPDRQVCGKLLEALADVNALSSKGQSALHLAAHAGMNDTVFWLAERMPPETINLPDRGGRTADYLAARKRFGNTTKVLQDHGAKASLRLKTIEDVPSQAAGSAAGKDTAPGEDTAVSTARTSTPPANHVGATSRPSSSEAIPPALLRDGSAKVLAALYARSAATAERVAVNRTRYQVRMGAMPQAPDATQAQAAEPVQKHPPKQAKGFMQMLSEAEGTAQVQ